MRPPSNDPLWVFQGVSQVNQWFQKAPDHFTHCTCYWQLRENKTICCLVFYLHRPHLRHRHLRKSRHPHCRWPQLQSSSKAVNRETKERSWPFLTCPSLYLIGGFIIIIFLHFLRLFWTLVQLIVLKSLPQCYSLVALLDTTFCRHNIAEPREQQVYLAVQKELCSHSHTTPDQSTESPPALRPPAARLRTHREAASALWFDLEQQAFLFQNKSQEDDV